MWGGGGFQAGAALESRGGDWTGEAVGSTKASGARYLALNAPRSGA